VLDENASADECADRLKFHLSTIIGERHPKTSRQHHDDVRDLIAKHLSAMVQLANTGFVRFLRDLRRSDHAPFWDAGIPAIMVTDTSNFRSPFYHTAMDRIEMIDFEFAAKVVLATAASIQRLASKSVTWGAKVPLSSRSQPRSTNSALQSTSPLSLPSSV
jgi:hypothetical protein